MIKYLKNLFQTKTISIKESAKILPAKDPMDWTLTESSKPWNTESYCPLCKASTTINEVITNICNTCGGHTSPFQMLNLHRSIRKIWDGEKWVVQRKYGNGEKDYTIHE